MARNKESQPPNLLQQYVDMKFQLKGSLMKREAHSDCPACGRPARLIYHLHGGYLAVWLTKCERSGTYRDLEDELIKKLVVRPSSMSTQKLRAKGNGLRERKFILMYGNRF